MDGLKSVGAGRRQGHVGPIIKFEVILVEKRGRMGNSHKGSDTSRQDRRCLAEGRDRSASRGTWVFAHTYACGGNSTVYLLCTFYPNALSTIFLLRSQSRGIFEFLWILR